ncbi:MAG TPA: NADP-dependent oxidoreductase [Longimicrobiaceae bacterium]|nr:NADP-dependent oxidoreductase [Longimicrobiaceae bacterium]
MQSAARTNRRIVLAARPRGEPVPSDFRLEEVPVPPVDDGHVLLQTLWLSLDPYMRGVMNEDASYASSTPIGGTMPGGTVSRVIESRHPDFTAGDLVVSGSGWQEYQVRPGRGLRKLAPDMPNPQHSQSVLGMPGFTAYHGLLDIGHPEAGETLVLAASTGAVGSIVGQLGKVMGCRVVGIAGGPEKCAYAVEELGYDASVDHRDPNMPELLRAACPDGIDVYFENVGGAVFDAVLPLLNLRARIPLCGLIAQYNAENLPPGPDRMPLLQMAILAKRILVQGFIISDHYVEDGIDNRNRWFDDLARWLAEGRIRYREDITSGLENAPRTFIGMLNGENFGKTMIQVAS